MKPNNNLVERLTNLFEDGDLDNYCKENIMEGNFSRADLVKQKYLDAFVDKAINHQEIALGDGSTFLVDVDKFDAAGLTNWKKEMKGIATMRDDTLGDAENAAARADKFQQLTGLNWTTINKLPFSQKTPAGEKAKVVNKGNQFEYLIEDVVNHRELYPQFNGFMEALEEIVGDKIVSASNKGALNQNRPMQIQDANTIYIPISKQDTSFHACPNIGGTVVDVEMITASGEIINISAKYGGSTDITGPGTAKWIKKEEVRKGEIVEPKGLELLSFFGIDPARFCKCFTDPGSVGGAVNIIDPSFKERMSTLLTSSFGYGYIFVHGYDNGKIEIIDYREPSVTENNFGASAIGNSTILYGGKAGNGKRVTVETTLNNGITISSVFRNKTAPSEDYPNYVCIGYTGLVADKEVIVEGLKDSVVNS